jgi:hypothetical protein
MQIRRPRKLVCPKSEQLNYAYYVLVNGEETNKCGNTGNSCTRHVRGMTQHYKHTATRAHKRGDTLGLYSLGKVRQFSTAIFEALDDGFIG